jgi:hypothetical protein
VHLPHERHDHDGVIYRWSGDTVWSERDTTVTRVIPHKRYALIVWLHGAGGSGDDNVRQVSGDQVPGTRIWTTPGNQSEHPAFLVAPQTNGRWSVPGESLDRSPEESGRHTSLHRVCWRGSRDLGPRLQGARLSRLAVCSTQVRWERWGWSPLG